MMIESTPKLHCPNINIFQIYVNLKSTVGNTIHNITVIHKTFNNNIVKYLQL